MLHAPILSSAAFWRRHSFRNTAEVYLACRLVDGGKRKVDLLKVDTRNCREWLFWNMIVLLYEMMNVVDDVGPRWSPQLQKVWVIRKVEGEIQKFSRENIWKNMQTYIFVELFWYILLECTKEWKSGYYLYRMWSFPCPNQLRIAKSAPVLVQHVKNTNDSGCGLSAHQYSCCVRFVSRQSSGEWTQGVVHRQLQCPGQVRFRNNLTLVIWKLGLDFLQFSGFFPVLCTIAFPTNLWILDPSVGFGLDNL